VTEAEEPLVGDGIVSIVPAIASGEGSPQDPSDVSPLILTKGSEEPVPLVLPPHLHLDSGDNRLIAEELRSDVGGECFDSSLVLA
jgi:hypothetical protein